ncbi:MAG TPA: methyltransferase domain-containing protein [Blastocatellia bacterium]|nr:methyltransferase domain-containing protein [Blastocatellia bacterium]
MTPFEFAYICLEPFLPPLYSKVRRSLIAFSRSPSAEVEILDAGGRKSHYTIAAPGNVTIIDLPRENELQRRLNLGIPVEKTDEIHRRRSNVRKIVLGDMTRAPFPDRSFDVVVSVEVLEHVEEDERFVYQTHRVLKPGGVFLMTTPNGDYRRNTNPDHKRHYAREQLRSLLARYFESVEVDYAIRGGRFHSMGLKSWSVRKPLQTLLSLAGNLINSIQSAPAVVKDQAVGACHLIGVARKSSD